MVSKSMVLNVHHSVIACRTLFKNGDGQVMLGALQASALNGGGLYYGTKITIHLTILYDRCELLVKTDTIHFFFCYLYSLQVRPNKSFE